MALQLRPYQQDIIDQARSLMLKGHRRMLICSPTGSGKTALTASMLGSASQKGMKCLFNVHRRELINQSMAAFDKASVPHGVVANGYLETKGNLVNIASIQSLSRRLHKHQHQNLVIWDECHHIAAGTWKKIFNYYTNAFHIGLTATPERLDGKGLREFFPLMIKGPAVSWLIENNYLADYKLYAPTTVNMSSVKTQMGDYKKSETLEIVDKPTIIGDAIREYKKVAMGKRAVVFAVSVKHSQHIVSQFNANGIEAVHVDGETNRFERDQAIKDFADGKIKVLSNVDLFGEGFDLPSLEVAILLRPTQSLGLYLQQVGRALRPSPGKSHAIILDHVGNVSRHGLPDEHREWSLDGRPKRPKGQSDRIPIKICKNCFAAQLPGAKACKHCHEPFPIEAREVEERDGDLQEVDKNFIKTQRKFEQKRADSLEDLVELGIKRGYKHPRRWAKHVFNARQAKRIGR